MWLLTLCIRVAVSWLYFCDCTLSVCIVDNCTSLLQALCFVLEYCLSCNFVSFLILCCTFYSIDCGCIVKLVFPVLSFFLFFFLSVCVCVCVCFAVLLAACTFTLFLVFLVESFVSLSPSPGIMLVWHYVFNMYLKAAFCVLWGGLMRCVLLCPSLWVCGILAL